MADIYPLHLCAGVFFGLLYDNRQSVKSHRSRTRGEEDELSQNSISYALTRVVLETFERPKKGSMDPDVSHMKNCGSENLGAAAPFDWPESRTALRLLLDERYPELLERWNAFLEKVLGTASHPGTCRKITGRLLDVMEKDETFPGYNDPVQGCFVTREELLAADTEILFQTFTLGVWAWICLNNSSNKIDSDILKEWRKAELPSRANVRVLTEEEIKNTASFSDGAEEKTVEAEPCPELAGEEAETAVAEKREKPAEKAKAAASDADREGLPVEYAEYMRRAQKKYGWLKTFLHPGCLTRFADCYVCPFLERIDSDSEELDFNSMIKSVIFTPELAVLLQQHLPIVLTGVGGLGKSMLLRFLLLSAIENYKQVQLVPVLVPLRNVEENCNSMEEAVLSELQQLWPDADAGQFRADLKRGRFLFLLDGLDEVKSAHRPGMVKLLNRFTETWQQNKFIVTSRPDDDFMDLWDFKEMQLQPFDTSQALEFVDKSNFRPDAPEISEEFKQMLTSGALGDRSAFTDNPLLLSILLLTYGKYRKIPSAMSEFYEQAYDVLARRHDKSKEGFRREWKTGLTPERFADVFGEFCARTYEDEQYTFTPAELERYFSRLSITKKGAAFTASDFIDDLVNGLCLMFIDGDRYTFIHRSFQEYFCARYYSRTDRESIEHFGQVLNHKFRNDSWGSSICLPMLYEMIPRQVEEYILLPEMRRVCAGREGEDGYPAFLQRIYPRIRYSVGEVPPNQTENIPVSYIYRYAVTALGLREPEQLILPAVPDFLEMRYVWEPKKNGKQTLAALDPWNGMVLPEHLVKWAGFVYCLRPETLFHSAEKYPELVAALCAPDCPLRKEYDRVREYTRQLQEKYSRLRDRRTHSLFE